MKKALVAKALNRIAKSLIAGNLDAETMARLDEAESQGKKYILWKKDGRLWRIMACKDFADVKKGDLGGLIASEKNLDQKGNCWVYEKAKAYGNAMVIDNACVYGNAEVYGDAIIQGKAQAYDNAEVYEKACIFSYAKIYGNSKVYGKAAVANEAKVFGNADVCDNAFVYGKAIVCGEAMVCFDAKVNYQVSNGIIKE